MKVLKTTEGGSVPPGYVCEHLENGSLRYVPASRAESAKATLGKGKPAPESKLTTVPELLPELPPAKTVREAEARAEAGREYFRLAQAADDPFERELLLDRGHELLGSKSALRGMAPADRAKYISARAAKPLELKAWHWERVLTPAERRALKRESPTAPAKTPPAAEASSDSWRSKPSAFAVDTAKLRAEGFTEISTGVWRQFPPPPPPEPRRACEPDPEMRILKTFKRSR